jgi:hypothetical protein
VLGGLSVEHQGWFDCDLNGKDIPPNLSPREGRTTDSYTPEDTYLPENDTKRQHHLTTGGKITESK